MESASWNFEIMWWQRFVLKVHEKYSHVRMFLQWRFCVVHTWDGTFCVPCPIVKVHVLLWQLYPVDKWKIHYRNSPGWWCPKFVMWLSCENALFSKIDCNEFIEYWISQSRNFEILCLNLRWLIRFWYTLCNFLNSSWFCTHCALVMFFISAFCYNVTQDNWKNVYFIYDVTWINRV